MNIDEFMRCIIRDPFTGKHNKRGKQIMCRFGIITQIMMLGDPQQLVTDISASYNVQRKFYFLILFN